MRQHRDRNRPNFRSSWRIPLRLAVLLGSSVYNLSAQSNNQESLSQQIQQLTDSMARTQAQLEQSQHQLDEMRHQLEVLQRQVLQSGQTTAAAPMSNPNSKTSSLAPVTSSAATNSALDDLRERQAIQESQITTQEQTKVETESKYSVKLTGFLLFNGFVNTRAVDVPATPTLALPGSGNTGASMRQTMLGFDARGPHVFGARSYADLWVDLNGVEQSSSTAGAYTGYYTATATLLRLRTAHVGLQWKHTDAYFSLDRPLFSPDAPTSLAAVAEPALAWSGNLWTWNPQVGVTQDIDLPGSHDLRLQAALIDVGDAPVSPSIVFSTSQAIVSPSTAEQSRWPGVEARIAWLDTRQHDNAKHFGVGGYFSPHLTSFGQRFDAWAGTLDGQVRLPLRLQLNGSFYRGLALGGLGGGAYKDYGYHPDPDSSGYYYRPFDDVGGWAQLKEKVGERLEFNTAFGLDNGFARELRRYTVAGGTGYQNLAKNRTYTGNVIYSPSAYLKFSLEYRHLESSPVVGAPFGANIIGLVVGYKF